MRLSTKGEYGLLAIIDLALHSNSGPVQSIQIAERQKIPKQYLDQLMLVLKKAGFVDSSRGRQGGYQLAKAPDSITLLDIVTALEGPLENINFAERSVLPNNPNREILRSVWAEIFDYATEKLQAMTLDQVCEQRKKMESHIMYYI